MKAVPSPTENPVAPESSQSADVQVSEPRLKKWYEAKRWYAAAFVVVFAAVGVYFIVASHADPLPAIAKPMTFSDNFDNLQTYGWAKFDEAGVTGASTWTGFQGAQSGVLKASGDVAGGAVGRDDIAKPGTYDIAGNYGWKDYSFTTRLKSDDDDGMGVIFHYTNSNNYYRFSMDRERGFRRLVKKVGGQYTTVWQDVSFKGNATATNASTDAFKKNQWYNLNVTVVGSAIQIKLVDESNMAQPVMNVQVQDSSLPSGAIGLYSWGMQNVFYDDVVVRATVGAGFTLAVLPDTQAYSQNDTTTRAAFAAQTQWIAENRGQQKIAFVLHEGDIVDDICDNQQWQRASTDMRMLDGKVPYAFTPGNHDVLAYDGCLGQTIDSATAQGVPNSTFPDTTYKTRTVYTNKLNQYFPVSRYQGMPGFGGVFKANDMSASYSLFSAGGADFVVISLPFGPTDAQLAWAKGVAGQYPARTAIVLTHDYLSEKSTLRGTNPDGTPCARQPIDYSTTIMPTPTVIRCTATNAYDPKSPSTDWALPSVAGTNTGYEIWTKLVKDQSNIGFVLNGHVAAPYKGATINYATEGSIGFLASTHSGSTRKVYQMLANYQSFPDGGSGYMRLLKFTPDAGVAGKWSITVSTYSPLTNTYLVNGVASPTRTEDGKNQFTINDVQL